ncbi:hypothetical protein [Echinicola vietnamensis]|uniref:Uncharacterized protein n=1 Tax=Echinicola vietnamensis (strain DSM 17526 / LMG 23754 / KMM 6221) TaxID=926556 RepID=L0FYL0_ECHVK|nr:hypothetical protein [Echinicola vietnamensis]AGA77851.1 hypothetical protein Echvi_1586 [Echinicola vietnamensis DSM 17526]
MTELIIYAIIFLLLFGHATMASMMYSQVHKNTSLSIKEKNDWKLKALIFPIYYWGQYKNATKDN